MCYEHDYNKEDYDGFFVGLFFLVCSGYYFAVAVVMVPFCGVDDFEAYLQSFSS